MNPIYTHNNPTMTTKTTIQSKLSPLGPSYDFPQLEDQPTINVGTLGHVAHGKSTIVEALSSKKTGTHSKEKRENLTIRLGYANCKIWVCTSDQHFNKFEATRYKATASDLTSYTCPYCASPMLLRRHISFVDCPGHEVLMATMLSGAAVMDAALIITSAAAQCPQPQTAEHLAAVSLLKIPDLILIQNKIDLVDQQRCQEHANEVKAFVKRTPAEAAPLIPTSANYGINLDVVAQALANLKPPANRYQATGNPNRIPTQQPRGLVIRSFDVNKCGKSIDQVQGGVLGGSLLTGKLRVGDRLEIRPGRVEFDPTAMRLSCRPLQTQVTSLASEKRSLDLAYPGGLIGIGTKLDPSLTRNDGLVGSWIGEPGSLPECYQTLVMKYHLMRRVVGSGEQKKIKRLRTGDKVLVNVGPRAMKGLVSRRIRGEPVVEVELESLVCAEVGQTVAISRRVESKWRLIGEGRILDTSTPVPVNYE